MRSLLPRSSIAPALLLALTACAPGVATRPAASPPVAPPPVTSTPPPAAPIAPAEYAGRRAELAAEMGEGVLIAFGSPPPEADYLPFAQNSPFRYLTGITEPGAALVIIKEDETVQENLFVLARDPAREVWEGERLGAEGAEALTGIPTRRVGELFPVLDSVLDTAARLYTVIDLPEGGQWVLTREQQIIARLSQQHPGVGVIPLAGELSRIRAGKSPAELDLLRRSIYITALAQRAAMRTIEPGMNEFEVEALIEYTFRRHGAERPSFATIVGSGPNATTLHYNADDRFMQAGDMVVMDIGASYRGYAADITRTVPVNGTFSPAQEAIYEIVLAAQKAAEEVVRPGVTSQEWTAAANRVLAEGLARLGLVESPGATYDCENEQLTNQCPQYRLFYMHGLGHGIGLDVHDPDLSYYGPFDVGSAFTIEPGIYVRGDVFDYLPDTPENRAMIERLRPAVEQYRNIGVRIEDDYFVTPAGVERVSAGAPREIEEIEALMARESVGGERRPEIVEWYRETEPSRPP